MDVSTSQLARLAWSGFYGDGVSTVSLIGGFALSCCVCVLVHYVASVVAIADDDQMANGL